MMLLKRLFRKPLRTTLAVLEVLLGTLAVTLALSAYLGSPQLNSGKSDTFELTAGSRNEKGETEEMYFIFTEEKLEEILKLTSDVEAIGINGSAIGYFPAQIHVNSDIFEPQFHGVVSPGYFYVMNMAPTRGSFFTKADRDQNVLVISDESAKIIFGNDNPIGQEFGVAPSGNDSDSTNFVTFKVIGTFADDKRTILGTTSQIPPILFPVWADKNSPVSASQEKLVVKARSGQGEIAREQILSAVRQVFKKSGEIPQEAIDNGKDFYIAELGKSYLLISNFIDPTVILFGIFGIVSLITGAIGIFSIMLVDTLERTHETGIRRAIGASKTRIMWEVSSEATVVSLLGGVLGIALAALLIPILNNTVGTTLFQQSELRWQPLAAFVALGSAVLLSTVLSLLPAWQAVKMKPIEALKGV
jgi:ABC-type antimicrobial peptide transport system permease subunit